MITPKEIDLKIYQGASFQKSWKIQDKEGNPVDLTGWSAFCHIRKKKASDDIILEATTENEKLFIEQGEDTVYGFDLEPEDTQIFTMKDAVYDIKLVDPQGHAVRIQEGKISVSLAVTRVWELQE